MLMAECADYHLSKIRENFLTMFQMLCQTNCTDQHYYNIKFIVLNSIIPMLNADADHHLSNI